MTSAKMCFLLGEDRQVFRREAEDGKPSATNIAVITDFRPLRRVASADGVLHSGDGYVQTIGNEAKQAEDRRKIKPLRALADLRNQQQSSGIRTDRNISSRKKRCS